MTGKAEALGSRVLDGLDVVVVGGGVVGATAALLLGEAGARVTLLERAAGPRSGGVVMASDPAGVEVLSGLALDVALVPVGDVAALPRGIDHRVRFGRDDLLAALLAAVGRHPRVKTCWGAEAVGALPEGTLAYVTRGHASETRVLHVDLIVAADGRYSQIRAAGAFGSLATTSSELTVSARWVEGRIVLLGGAAHAWRPDADNRASPGIADAAALVRVICSAALAGMTAKGTIQACIPAALETFERRRRLSVG